MKANGATGWNVRIKGIVRHVSSVIPLHGNKEGRYILHFSDGSSIEVGGDEEIDGVDEGQRKRSSGSMGFVRNV